MLLDVIFSVAGKAFDANTDIIVNFVLTVKKSPLLAMHCVKQC